MHGLKRTQVHFFTKHKNAKLFIDRIINYVMHVNIYVLMNMQSNNVHTMQPMRLNLNFVERAINTVYLQIF